MPQSCADHRGLLNLACTRVFRHNDIRDSYDSSDPFKQHESPRLTKSLYYVSSGLHVTAMTSEFEAMIRQ